jgi:hypothetical protein
MSKFLINLLLQISKALVYSKIKLLFGKEFFLTFGPIGPAASQPIRPFSPATTHFFLFNRPCPPLSPLGLGLSAGPACPLSPTYRALVAPCPIAASLTGKCLTSRRLCPSSCLTDRWAPPLITFLRRRRAPLCATASSSRHGCHALLSLWPTVTTP